LKFSTENLYKIKQNIQFFKSKKIADKLEISAKLHRYATIAGK